MKRGPKKLPELLQEVYKGEYTDFYEYLKDNNIKELDLSNQSPHIENSSQVVHLLKALHGSGVTGLNLADHYIGTSYRYRSDINKDMEAIAKALRNSGLINLNFANNALSDKDMKIIAKGLSNTIVELNFSRNNIGKDGKGSSVEDIAKAISKMQLTHLDLSQNKIYCKGIIPIAKIINVMPTLCHLNLSGNWLKDEGAKILAEKGLQNRDRFTLLDLSSTRMTFIGAKAIAEALPNEVNSFNLRANQLQDEGAKYIAKAIQKKTISDVNLSCNQITAAGSIELAKAFLMNPEISINLSANQIGDQGTATFAKVLPMAKTNAYLNLDLNQQSPKANIIKHADCSPKHVSIKPL